MAKKLNSVLGIDIGSQRIKVAELRSQGREPVVTALGITPTPEGAVDHTGVYNSDAVAVALKQCIQDAGVSVPAAVVSIAGQASVLVRTLEVPRMNPNELKEHMAWEINRNIPFAESTVLSDFRALPDEDPASPNMDVVMAISPQSAIDTIILCVKRAGKQVAAIDVEPLALGRSLVQSYGNDFQGQTICLIDMGHKTTSINIYRNGKLLLPRQIPIGGEMFTRAIADALGVSMTDADAIKQQKALIPDSASNASATPAQFNPGGPTTEFQAYNPFSDEPAPPAPVVEPDAMPEPLVTGGDPETIRIYNAFAGVLDEFVAEVRRSIDYFRSRGGDISRIVLSGGGTKLGGLSTFLSKSLSVECDSYDPLQRLNLNVRKVAPGFVDEHRQEFAVAIGNALHIFFD